MQSYNNNDFNNVKNDIIEKISMIYILAKEEKKLWYNNNDFMDFTYSNPTCHIEMCDNESFLDTLSSEEAMEYQNQIYLIDDNIEYKNVVNSKIYDALNLFDPQQEIKVKMLLSKRKGKNRKLTDVNTNILNNLISKCYNYINYPKTNNFKRVSMKHNHIFWKQKLKHLKISLQEKYSFLYVTYTTLNKFSVSNIVEERELVKYFIFANKSFKLALENIDYVLTRLRDFISVLHTYILELENPHCNNNGYLSDLKYADIPNFNNIINDCANILPVLTTIRKTVNDMYININNKKEILENPIF